MKSSSEIAVWFERLPVVLQGPVFIGSAGGVIGTVATLLIAVGNISAVGFSTAWTLYGTLWVAGPFWGIGVGVAFGAFFSGILFAIIAADKFIREHASFPWSTLKVALWSLVACAAAFYVLQAASVVATRRNLELTRGSASQTVEDQKQSLIVASDNATKLLAALDATEVDVRAAKEQLRKTLLTLQEQQKAVVDSGASLHQASDRQALLQAQLAELQSALGGREPITRADLEGSQRWGLIQGAVLGIVTSVLAAYVVRGLSSWRIFLGRIRRKPTT